MCRESKSNARPWQAQAMHSHVLPQYPMAAVTTKFWMKLHVVNKEISKAWSYHLAIHQIRLLQCFYTSSSWSLALHYWSTWRHRGLEALETRLDITTNKLLELVCSWKWTATQQPVILHWPWRYPHLPTQYVLDRESLSYPASKPRPRVWCAAYLGDLGEPLLALVYEKLGPVY